jgi:hypothetical protein
MEAEVDGKERIECQCGVGEAPSLVSETPHESEQERTVQRNAGSRMLPYIMREQGAYICTGAPRTRE